MNKKNFIIIIFLILKSCLVAASSNDPYPPINTGSQPNNIQASTLKKVDKPTSIPKLEIPLPPLQSNSNNVLTQSSASVVSPTHNDKPSTEVKETEDEEDKEIENKKRKEDLVNQLIELDYKTKIPPKQLYQRQDTKDNKHLPPVYFKSYYLSLAFNAVKNDDLNALRAVLDNYNFLNGQNKDGDTLLIYAIEQNSINSARVLLARGAFVNGVNSRGRTPLHYAATIGNLEMVKLLLTMGADPEIMDDVGMKAEEYAISSNNKQAADMIRKFD